ncbi:hypothetical protein HFO56_03050 [Rhizobium laguerreae]|uniref:hypothetical protein n=1 Tax=Rhizobium laguerreae TaxID=1076926 RepID=UPI001C8FB4C7|nr:hypothetical protein [Rhizobium laguerreae]MBY3151365.1 hypothetical protein [Rhizobium laguerreae]
MKISFQLPLLVRGRPRTSRNVTDVFCTTTFTSEIEEVSLREMDIVFEVRERLHITGRLSPAQREELKKYKAFGKGEPFRLRTCAGATYRRIAVSASEAIKRGLFSTPFDDRISGRLAEPHQQRHGWPTDCGGDISPIQVQSGNKPLARALTDEFEWRLDRQSIHGLKSKTAWPRPPLRGNDYSKGWHTHRNAINFAEAGIQDVVAEDLDLAFAMYESQARKLLIADGEVWMKTRPPAYRVQFIPGTFRSSPSWIDISMVTAPEGYVGDLLTQHFSLRDADEATETARQLYGNEADWGEGFTKEFSDFRKPYECADETLLDYDYQQEEINRFGYTAAVESWAYLKRNPEKAERLNAQQIALIEAAYNDVAQVNHVLGIHQDMTDYVPALEEAWKRLGHRQTLTGLQGIQWHAETAAERALRYVENAPISLKLPPLTSQRSGI